MYDPTPHSDGGAGGRPMAIHLGVDLGFECILKNGSEVSLFFVFVVLFENKFYLLINKFITYYYYFIVAISVFIMCFCCFCYYFRYILTIQQSMEDKVKKLIAFLFPRNLSTKQQQALEGFYLQGALILAHHP